MESTSPDSVAPARVVGFKGIALPRLGLWLLFPCHGLYGHLYTTGMKLPAYFFLYAPCLLVLLLYYINQPKWKPAVSIPVRSIPFKSTFYLLLILIMFASFRSISYDWHSPLHFLSEVLFIIILLLFFNLYFASEKLSPPSGSVWIDLGIGIAVLIIMNLVAYYGLGITSTYSDAYIQELSTRISFLESRLEFPLTTNTREVSQIAGLLVIMSFFYYKGKYLSHNPLLRMSLAFCLIAISILAILLADARMTLMMTMFGVLFFLVARTIRFRTFLSVGAAILFLFMPLWYFLATFYMNRFSNINIFESGTWTLSNRLYVWASVIPEILGRSMSEFLFGSGYYSQAVTGLSDNYAEVFNNWFETSRISYHNSVLQMIFDVGVVGITIYLVLLYFLLRSLVKRSHSGWDRNGRDSIILGLTILVYYLGLGATEAITPLYYDSYLIVIIILKTYLDSLDRSTVAPQTGDQNSQPLLP